MRTTRTMGPAILLVATACGGGQAAKEATSAKPAGPAEAVETEPPEAETSAAEAWPTFRGGLQRTGVRGSPPAASGWRQAWRFETGGKVESSPTVVDGRVFVGSFSGALFALDARTGAEVWRFDTGALVRASPSLVDGTVFFGADDNHFYALDAASGAQRWRFALGPGGEQSTPAVTGGVVYFGAFDQNVYALDAATGAERWRYATGGGILSSPAVAGGLVVIGSMDGALHGIDATSGAGRWVLAPSAEPIFASPAVADGTTFVGSYDDHVYAVDLGDGSERWRRRLGGDIFGSPAVVDGQVFIGAADGFYALDAGSGEVRWSHHDGGRIFGSPAVAATADRLFVGTSDAGVIVYTLSGEEIARLAIEQEVWSSVFVDGDGSLYFGSHNGGVYAFRPEDADLS